MSALYLQASRTDKDGIVGVPQPTDAIGAALRGVFGHPPKLPDDMARLLARLDHTQQR